MKPLARYTIALVAATAAGMATARIAERSTSHGVRALTHPESYHVPDTLSLEHLDSMVDSFLMLAPLRGALPAGTVENTEFTPAAPALPTFFLRGTVGGPPWTALISGVPGRDGDVALHIGDSIGNARIVGVDRASVRLRSADSTWTVGLTGTWR